MKYKEKVISDLDGIANQLNSIRNMIENNNINKELLVSELSKLNARVENISDMVSLEDADFTTLRQGIKR